MHQGNLFVTANGDIVAIDFGIMGRIDRRARMWLAEILYGLITGNYRRVAEIHFEAQYVPRSEEHTSELQSLMRISYAVFCLKKKNTLINKVIHHAYYLYSYNTTKQSSSYIAIKNN